MPTLAPIKTHTHTHLPLTVALLGDINVYVN